MPGSVSRREARSRALAASALAAAAPAWAAPSAAPAAARGVLTRLFGPAAARVALTLEPASARPWYAAEARNGALSVRGDSAVALARGAYAWMRQTGAAHVSWEGDRLALPARW